jgi:hypothetical protein
VSTARAFGEPSVIPSWAMPANSWRRAARPFAALSSERGGRHDDDGQGGDDGELEHDAAARRPALLLRLDGQASLPRRRLLLDPSAHDAVLCRKVMPSASARPAGSAP